jgi:phospholipid/cholesterol/gamma-HCH transport system permease protein
MDAFTLGPVWDRVLEDARELASGSAVLTVDVSAVAYCDGAGAGLLHGIERQAADLGSEIEMVGMNAAVEGHLKPYREADAIAVQGPVHRSPRQLLREGVIAVGNEIRTQITFIGEVTRALVESLAQPRRVRWGDTLKVAEAAGFQALPIVSLIAFLLGVILAFQSAIAMRQFGAEIFVANLVSISLFRELGPLMMAILLAGRSGAAFAAEIGTMKVNEEVSALTTMGLDPVRFLVVPKVLASLFVAPLLALYANLIGLVGAALVMRGFGIPLVAFFQQVSGAVTPTDLGSGLFKAVVFGLLVATVGCLRGLQTGNGAASVGRSTTSAVVTAIILIVVADGLFAVLFYQLGI